VFIVPVHVRRELGLDLEQVAEILVDAVEQVIGLAQPTLAPPPRRRATKRGIRPDLVWLLRTVSDAAAFVRNSRMESWPPTN
jgi:hypothetical protein